MVKTLDWNAPLEDINEDWKAATSSKIFRDYVRASLRKEASENAIKEKEKIEKEAFEKNLKFPDFMPHVDAQVLSDINKLANFSPIKRNLDYGTERNVPKEKATSTGNITENYDLGGVKSGSDADIGQMVSESQPDAEEMERFIEPITSRASLSEDDKLATVKAINSIDINEDINDKIMQIEAALGLDSNMYYKILKARRG